MVRCRLNPSMTDVLNKIMNIFVQAANYLGIKTLLAVGCKTIANMVRGKASEEVREMFSISRDPPGEGLNANNDDGLVGSRADGVGSATNAEMSDN